MSAPERPMELRAEIDRLRAEKAASTALPAWSCTPAERTLIEAALAYRSGNVPHRRLFVAADAVLAERMERDSE